jgi:hypothetical protein
MSDGRFIYTLEEGDRNDRMLLGGQDHARHGQRHGGQPEAFRFCHDAGLDYVSCSAPRVPIARLAGAQAALQGRRPT